MSTAPAIVPPSRPPPTARPATPAAPSARAAATALPSKSAPPPPKASRLGAVKRGLLREAKRFYFYGPEGVGKSSLAADAGAIFFDTDRGSGHLDVARYPFRDGEDGHVAHSLDEVYAGIDDLLVGQHDYKALAIDTADALEALVWAKVCDGKISKGGDKIESIEDFGYGKGYVAAAAEWRKLLHRLDELRLERGMHIIFIGHVLVKPYKNPLGEDYDKIRPKLDDRALGLLKEWCEVLGFISFDDLAKKAPGSNRARGVSIGSRIIRLQHNAAWDAKSRLPLAAEVPLTLVSPWAPFEAAIDALYASTPDGLRARIAEELGFLGETFTRPDGAQSTADSVREAVAHAGDNVATLTKYLTVLTQSKPITDSQEQSK